MGKKFPKSVSFNTNNPNDQRILEHVKRRNFSGYVKKLILDDIALTAKDTPTQRPQSKLERLLNGSDDISDKAYGSTDSKSD